MVKRNQYDVTVDATIVDVSQKPDGIYRVKTTGAEFEAYATAGSYYKNDIVLVQIPNGDYKNPKFILGRKADVEENKTFAFKLPFDDFIGLQDLQGDINSQTSGAYWANWPETSEAQYNLLNTLVWHWEGNGDSTVGNTRIGIEANWQTFLGAYFPIRGSYGFRIVVNGTTASTELTAATDIERSYYFTNVDMYGNPYAYQTPFAQQKVLDVSDFLKINQVDIYFYQDFNFADHLNAAIYYEEKDAVRPFVPQNILFNGLKVYLGVAAEDLTDESTFLYSHQSLSYDSKEKTIYDEELNMKQTVFSCDEKKKALFTWVHYESDGTFSVIKDNTDLMMQRDKAGKKTHIFWYRYDYDATDTEMIWDIQNYPTHQALKDDWIDSVGDPMSGKEPNPNYECPMERYAGPHWEFLPNYTDRFEVEFTPRGNKSREKFKVVVQHDGTHTTSKELVFKNNRDIEAELLAGAKNDAAILKTYRIAKVNGAYEAIEDGSINAFHVYDENNKILVNDDGDRFDHHYYYMQIHVRDEEDNLYRIIETVSGTNTPVSTGTSIAWAFPRSYTMIASTEEVTLDDAKYFDVEQNPDSVEFQNFHNATIKFKIGSTYNNRYLDNTVGAIINQNGKTYHIEKDLMFGRAEGLGHEFLPVIEIVNPVGGTYLHCGDPNEFAIACAVYNKDGSLFEKPELLTFTWRELSQQCDFYHIDVIDGQEQRYDTYKLGTYKDLGKPEELESSYIEKYKGYRGNVVSGSIIIPEDGFVKPPIFEVTVNGAASYPLTVRKGFMICNDAKHKQTRDIFVPSRVEFKSDGADPIFYANYFEVAQLISDPDASYAEYNIEHPEWKINEQDTLSLRKTTTPREFIEHDENGDIVVSDQGYDKYQLIFNGGEKAKPQWMNSYLDPERYTYIYYNYINDEGLNIYLAQSIAFDRNYYASSLVNNWDGTSLTWDEENGAILSTMIAAGSKDANNRFTGVMMGDWHAKGDESLDVPGMYGYNNGEQTFGFKTDGTGFIGGSGRGRIEFDGREAVISNADRSCYINLNPVSVSLDYNSLNNQSFSQNFIYCKVPKSKNEFDSLSDSIAGKASWAKKYFEDKNNDYFVVDPNYGVLTTGGIIAKYGALGNWMISNQGMYQKKIYEANNSDESNKYMYMGFDETDASYARTWTETKSNLQDIKNEISTFETNLDIWENEISATQALIEQKESEKANLGNNNEEKINECQSKIQAASNNCIDINDRIDELNESIKDIETVQIPNMREQQQNNITTINENKKLIDTYESLIKEYQNEIAMSNDAYATQLIVVQNHLKSLKQIQDKNESYNILINDYTIEFENLLTDKNHYLNIINELNLSELESNYNKISEDIINQQIIINGYETEYNNNNDSIVSLRNNINDMAILLNIDIVFDSVVYQQELSNIENDINNLKSIINNTNSSAEEIATAKEQLALLDDKKIKYTQLISLLQNYEALLENQIILESSINDAQSILNDNLIPQQQDILNNLNKAYDNKIIYENALNKINSSIITLRSNIDILAALFKQNYTNIHDLNNEIENSNINMLQDELTYDELTANTAPRAYPTNQNTYSEDNSYIRFQFLLLNNYYMYLVTIIGDNTIQGSLESLLLNREEQLKEKTEGNEELAAIYTEIERLENEINILNKLNDNPNYTSLEDAGLKQINNILDQNIQQQEILIKNYKEELITAQNRLKEEQDIISTNKNLIITYNNGYQQIEDNIQNLQLYLQKTQNNIDNGKARLVQIKELLNTIQNNIIKATADLTTDFEKQELHADSSFEDMYIIIDNMIIAVDDIILSQSTRYAIYISSAEPMSASVSMPVMPYFSVDWNGSMFARRGKIANTWEINDYSLTYQKNNVILYLGSENYAKSNMETEPNILDNPCSLGRAEFDLNKRWAISASDKFDPNNPKKEYYINFGVSSAGELFSQWGRIGGWTITSHSLESAEFDIPNPNDTTVQNKNKIIFDAQKGTIEFSNGSFAVDGRTGTVSLGKKYGDGTEIGNVYLADYLLTGLSRSDVVATGPLASSQENKTTTKTIGKDGYDNGWGNTSDDYSKTVSVSVGTSTWLFQTDYQILLPNYFQIMDKNLNSDTGIVMATGIKATPNDKGEYVNTKNNTILLYPTIDGSTLGTTSLKWNLIANTISASLIDAGGINGEEVYMNKELVATEKAMYNALADLWNALDNTDSSAASAGQKARAAMGKAQEALNELAAFQKTMSNVLKSLITNVRNLNNAYTGHGHQIDCVTDISTSNESVVKSVGLYGSMTSGYYLSDHTTTITEVSSVSQGKTSTGTPSQTANFETETLTTPSFSVDIGL